MMYRFGQSNVSQIRVLAECIEVRIPLNYLAPLSLMGEQETYDKHPDIDEHAQLNLLFHNQHIRQAILRLDLQWVLPCDSA